MNMQQVAVQTWQRQTPPARADGGSVCVDISAPKPRTLEEAERGTCGLVESVPSILFVDGGKRRRKAPNQSK
ncbi:hypothetical protein IQ268_02005 [Oculatella sp. LEGE 06141]|uniref:hypothetical protein n=1 Tax=Oculatella sp. LEGE 06141 TaxID=1828648 RepID=UPI001880EDEF|nr:hypothetical protein [Oculatella sp. LEGE 06141]MBE9177347.1 hypothetical protein [Oculatella sp. LEGE 06141]